MSSFLLHIAPSLSFIGHILLDRLPDYFTRRPVPYENAISSFLHRFRNVQSPIPISRRWREVSLIFRSLHAHALQAYRGDNLDTIDQVFIQFYDYFIENCLYEIPHYNDLAQRFMHVYILLARHSLTDLTEQVFTRSSPTIQNHELFKFITQFIASPILLFARQLRSTGYAFSPQGRNAIDEASYYNTGLLERLAQSGALFFESLQVSPAVSGEDGIQVSDIHIHAETFYSFSDLIHFFLHLPFPPHRQEDARRDSPISDTINFIYDIILYFTFPHQRTLNTLAPLNSITKKEQVARYYLQNNGRLSYPQTVHDLVYKVMTFPERSPSQEDLTRTFDAVILLQKLNRLMGSVAATPIYQGLQHMGHYFRAGIRQAFRLFRANAQHIQVSSLESSRPPRHVEIRLSLEAEPLKYWHKILDGYANSSLANVPLPGRQQGPSSVHPPKSSVSQLGSYGITLHYQKANVIKQAKDILQARPGNLFTTWEEHTRHLINFLERSPQIRRAICGIDAASIERWTPPWMYRTLYKIWELYFRHHLQRTNFHINFHAGEEYSDLLSGYRTVYEALYFLNVDRIGHGLVMLIDTPSSHLYLRTARIPAFMFLLNVLFLNHMIGQYPHYFFHIRQLPDRYKLLSTLLHTLNTEYGIDVLSKFSSPLTSPGASDALELLYKNLGFFPSIRRWFGIPVTNIYSRLQRAAIMRLFPTPIHRQYGMKAHTFLQQISRNNHKPIKVAPILPPRVLSESVQYELADALRNAILDQIKRRRVVLEVCPSSNVLLLNIPSYDQHPYFSLSPDDQRELRITINTDNPLLYNTNPLLEHILMAEAYEKRRNSPNAQG